MPDRARIFRAPAPGDRLVFLDGSKATVVQDLGGFVQVLVQGAPELQEWPHDEFELAVLGATAVEEFSGFAPKEAT